METEVLFEAQFTVRRLFEPLSSDQNIISLSEIANNECIVILTANRRQSRHLQQAFSRLKTPKRDLTIASYQQWVSSHYQDLRDQYLEHGYPHLISAMQKSVIWEQITQNDETLSALIDRQSIAKNIQEAHDTLLAYEIPLTELSCATDPETEFLLSCIQRYEQYLEYSKMISAELTPHVIVDIYKKHHLQADRQFYLYGFAEITPSMRSLLSQISLESYSIAINQHSQKINDAQTVSKPEPIGFDNLQQELKAACLWAKQQLESEQEKRIAIVAPNLTTIKPSLETQLLRTFDTQHFFSNTHFITNKYFDISVAEPLIHAPIIDSIFLLFDIRKDELDKQSCLKLCRNPFWGNTVETDCSEEESCEAVPQINKEEADNSFRLTSFNHVRLKILHWVKTYSSPLVPSSLLVKVWARYEHERLSGSDENSNSEEKIQQNEQKTDSQRLLAFRDKLRRAQNIQKSFSAWVNFVKEALEQLAWPGRRTPNTYEYQQLQRFFQLLQEVQTIDLCPTFDRPSENAKAHKHGRQSLSLVAFIYTLKNICKNTSFHMQTNDAPLSVLGLMESSCLPFDACWLLNASSDVLPSPPNPNPFIPFEVQTKYQTPRSSDQRETEYANYFVSDLEKYCNELIVSYSKHHNDSNQECSPLFSKNIQNVQDSQHSQNTTQNDFDLYCQQAIEFTSFDQIISGKAPKIPKGEKLKGGSGHISLFGVNPFYAYLRYQLGVSGNHAQSLGYTALERGNIIHDILHKIYTDHKSQDNLKNWYSNKSFKYDLSRYIEKSLLSIQKRSEKNVAKALFDSEKHYIFNQLNTFINRELDRDSFETVATEMATTINISGYQITVRIDRIDTQSISLEHNVDPSENSKETKADSKSLAIFDYKTSNTISLSGIRNTPLHDAQLPLYSLIDFHNDTLFKNYTIDAVVYCQIASSQIQYHGLSNTTSPAEKKSNLTQSNPNKPEFNTSSSSVTIQIPNLKPAVDSRNKIDGVNNWQELLHWWKQQITYSVEGIGSGICHFEIRNKAKSGFHEDLLIAVRDEEIEAPEQHSHYQENDS